MGCLRCCAGSRYLLSGGDGDPPDAVHVGRVSIGELRGGEVALAVLKSLPTGCEGGKAGVSPPGSPPASRRAALGSDPPLPPAPCTLLPPKFPAPRTALQKTTITALLQQPQKAPNRTGVAGDAPGSPAPLHKHRAPPPSCRAPGAGAVPRPLRALPRHGGPARRPGSRQVYAAVAGSGPALPSGSHMMPRPRHTALRSGCCGAKAAAPHLPLGGRL